MTNDTETPEVVGSRIGQGRRARTNYFLVEDQEKFLKEMQNFDVRVATLHKNEQTYFALYRPAGNWPWQTKDGSEVVLFEKLVTQFLLPGSLVVFQHMDADAANDSPGIGTAFQRNGQRDVVEVNRLDHLHKTGLCELPVERMYEYVA